MATTYAEALQKGWNSVYALKIEGIPYLFVEKAVKRLDADGTLAPPTSMDVVEALFISDNADVSQDLDRGNGIAKGGAIDFTLTFKGMESHLAENVCEKLFKIPSKIATITSDVAASSLHFVFDDLDGFVAGNFAYIGREYFEVGVTGPGQEFNALARGLLSSAWDYKANSVSAYRKVTDVPLVWRGRRCTLYEHLISPEERAPDTTWLTGNYYRVVWEGYLDAVPEPGEFGMQLRALPLTRALGRDVGFSINSTLKRIEAEGSSVGDYYTAVEPGFFITMSFEYQQISPVLNYEFSAKLFPNTTSTVKFYSRWSFAHDIAAAIDAAIAGSGFIPATPAWQNAGWDEGTSGGDPNDVVYKFRMPFDFGSYAFTKTPIMKVGAAAESVLMTGTYDAKKMPTTSGDKMEWQIPRTIPTGSTWVVLDGIEGNAWNDYDFPAAGVAIIDSDNVKEIVSYANATTSFAVSGPNVNPGDVALQITERGMAGTQIADMWTNPGGKFIVCTGGTGKLKELILKFITSSGTGLRSATYDTLQLGFGYAINDTFIDEDSFDSLPYSEDKEIVAVKEKRANLSNLLGGWIALQGSCIAQVNDTDTTQKLTMVPWRVTNDPDATVLAKADCLLGTTLSRQVMQGPNEVRIHTESLEQSTTDITVRDIPRIQCEGPQGEEFDCPSMGEIQAVGLAGSYLAVSEGLASISLQVAPWVTLNVGDAVKLELEHPMIFDWDTGTRGSPSVMSRVIGVSKNLAKNTQQVTFLVNGQSNTSILICPTGHFVSLVGLTTIGLAPGEGAYFKDGEDIYVYNKGREDVDQHTTQVQSHPSADVIVVSPALPAGTYFIAGVTSLVTFPNFTSPNISARQQAYAYVRDDRIWTP